MCHGFTYTARKSPNQNLNPFILIPNPSPSLHSQCSFPDPSSSLLIVIHLKNNLDSHIYAQTSWKDSQYSSDSDLILVSSFISTLFDMGLHSSYIRLNSSPSKCYFSPMCVIKLAAFSPRDSFAFLVFLA